MFFFSHSLAFLKIFQSPFSSFPSLSLTSLRLYIILSVFFFAPATELLWTSPELLRNPKGNNKFGTQAGDVYSFGIIMQEVVVRGEPYCMLSLSAEEIISKLKKPPPLIRPSVSKGAAPPEAINIMRQCWAETPDMRPDFNS